MKTIYTRTEFFTLFACTTMRGPMLDIFCFGEWHKISYNRFSRLVVCSFIVLGREWMIDKDTIKQVN